MSEEEKTPLVIRIRDLRRERSLTQEELAEALGLSRQSINAMEAGRCLPSLPVALNIADFFAVPLTTIFNLPDTAQAEVSIVSYSPPNPGKEESMANLVPWSPLREMQRMLDDMMDETIYSAPLSSGSGPAVNVSQTERDVLVDVRIPGFTTDNLTIEAGEDFLTVAGETSQTQEDGAAQYFRREFVSQSFSRTVSLPALVQGDKAEASMKNGVLHVRIPKIVEERPKTSKINIKSED
jgi:HSP20 family protein